MHSTNREIWIFTVGMVTEIRKEGMRVWHINRKDSENDYSDVLKILREIMKEVLLRQYIAAEL